MKRISVSLLAALIAAIGFQGTALARVISNTINATYTVQNSIFYVSTAEEFINANTKADDGDTIYIKGESTINLKDAVNISKSITVSAEPGKEATIEFTGSDARLNLTDGCTEVSGLNFTKSSAGEMINITSPEGASINNNSFEGGQMQAGIGVVAACIFGEAGGANIAENTFNGLQSGVVVTSWKNTVIDSNIFTNISADSGAVVVDTDANKSAGDVNIINNTIDTSTLCYWKNTKIGTSDNVAAAWFDEHVKFENKPGAPEPKVYASVPLYLSLISESTVNNVVAGTVQQLKFNAKKVSDKITLDNVKFVMQWSVAAEKTGDLSSIDVTGADCTATPDSTTLGRYLIDAKDRIDGDYTLNISFGKKGTYDVEIYGEIF